MFVVTLDGVYEGTVEHAGCRLAFAARPRDGDSCHLTAAPSLADRPCELVAQGFAATYRAMRMSVLAGVQVVLTGADFPAELTDGDALRCGQALYLDLVRAGESHPRVAVMLLIECARLERTWREAGWLEQTPAALARRWLDTLRTRVVTAGASRNPVRVLIDDAPAPLLEGEAGQVLADWLSEAGVDLQPVAARAAALHRLFLRATYAATETWSEAWEHLGQLSGALTGAERQLIVRAYTGEVVPGWGPRLDAADIARIDAALQGTPGGR